MNKSELIKEVALKGQLSFREAANAVDAMIETIAETMQKERISLWSVSEALSSKSVKRVTDIIRLRVGAC